MVSGHTFYRYALVMVVACWYCSRLVGQSAGADEAHLQGANHFRYDTAALPDLKQVSSEKRGGVTIEEITYASPLGGLVPASLVIPDGPASGGGKFAAVIWGHWIMPKAANANRSEFLEEAVGLARADVISLLIDSPQARPGFKATPNPLLVEQQVEDLRRGMDVLLARKDVDPKRVAYVGHSWDAGTGAILDAVDKRFAAFVFMSGPQSTKEYLLTSDSPRVAPMRKNADMAKVEKTLDANAWADPASYAAQFGPAPALFQYALHDEEWVPLQDAKDYVAMSSGPKEVQFYDSDHALNELAKRDRDGFLRKWLGLR